MKHKIETQLMLDLGLTEKANDKIVAAEESKEGTRVEIIDASQTAGNRATTIQPPKRGTLNLESTKPRHGERQRRSMLAGRRNNQAILPEKKDSRTTEEKILDEIISSSNLFKDAEKVMRSLGEFQPDADTPEASRRSFHDLHRGRVNGLFTALGFLKFGNKFSAADLLTPSGK